MAIKASATTQDVDKGYAKITSEIKSLKGRSVKVGIMGDGAVTDYAMYNEFGTRHIPARPFMGTTADRYGDELNKLAQFMLKSLLNGQTDTTRILNVLGMWYVSKMKDTVKNAKDWAVPDSPATIAAKGSSSPLIDTGRMINSISYEITTG